MDNAVALVQAYLRLNGYFTVSEYPVIAAGREGYRTATDLDVMAFRFPHAGRVVPGRRPGDDEEHLAPDPVLGAPGEASDMIIGEVKEGRAAVNAAARDPRVLRAVLVAFGCCTPDEAPALAARIAQEGRARLPGGHEVRLVAFGGQDGAAAGPGVTVISLGHVVEQIREYLRQHWEIVRHMDAKDPAFGFLLTLEKAGRVRA